MVLDNYKIFGSELRGTEEVENRIKSVIREKETPENLKILATALSAEWKNEDQNVSRLKLSFSKFEEKLEERKAEIFRLYAMEKEKNNRQDDDNFHQKDM